jgi:cysteine-rich repeat protein
MTPCGPADSFGKSSCPIAPNGLEMICMDENELSIGGPFNQSDPLVPNYLYKHCYVPLTVDNTEMYAGIDPPRNACGNYVREGDEECDDGNTDAADGCDIDCKVTAACTFKVKEPNGDLWATPPQSPVIEPSPKHIAGVDYDPNMVHVVSLSKCGTFKVSGALETAGDVDTIAIRLDPAYNAWLETYTGGLHSCAADLITEVRAWGNFEKTALLNFLDPAAKCGDLTQSIKNLDLDPPTLCSSGNLGCGSCSKPGLCGQCDDDSGYGNCTRMLLSTTTSYSGYKVDFDGKYKMIRVYSRDATKTVPEYTMIVSRFTGQSNTGSSTPPALSCY